jgi:hypothetical protein
MYRFCNGALKLPAHPIVAAPNTLKRATATAPHTMNLKLALEEAVPK